ncbi:hypothetical protein CPS_0503 [Colwellia psychrerythraea 34H]|uniref:Uncharacterized protein n=1 Tax=Colwellia psychrerythraea (strain 34H / ATCC BAA-681) TaxID=167879 RepID=Q489K3_COLP3|nr:hypothetical protein CPS_0503 [Colwellia psychrerythraea 34H]
MQMVILLIKIKQDVKYYTKKGSAIFFSFLGK